MMLGVGAGLGSAHGEATGVKAAVGDKTTLFNISSKSDWSTSASTYSSKEWTDETQNCTFAYASNSQKGWAFVRLCPGKNKTNDSYIKCLTPTTTLTSSVVVTVYSTKSSNDVTINSVKLLVYSDKTFATKVDEISYDTSKYATGDIAFTPSSSYGATVWASGVYFKYIMNIKNSNTKNNNGSDISKIVAVEGTSKTLSGLEITSGLDTVKKEYSAGKSFDSTGLVVTATYDDTSTADVTSSVVWSPDPLTEGTTSVTGTFGEYSVIVDGLTVGPAVYDNTFSIESGAKYIISQDSKYFVSNGTSTPSASSKESEATLFIFTLVGDDTFEIKTIDGSYLYTTDANDGVRVGTTADKWLMMTETETGSKYTVIKSFSNNRYLTLYNAQFRCYTSASQSRSATTIFTKYTAPSFTITGAPTENIEIEASGTLGISVEGLSVTWSSSDSNVVDIDNNGDYIAYAGGLATITATDSEGNTATALIVVNYGVISIAEANTLCAALETSSATDYKVTLKDTYVTEITNTQKIILSDNVVGTSSMNSILMFDFTALQDLSSSALLNGRVTVTGNLQKYNSTYEIVNPVFTYTDTAIEFAQEFNNAVASICTEAKQNDDNSAELANIWDVLESYYDDVETTYAKPKLKEATTEDTNADIAKMIGLYDHIVKRYGNKLGDNYNFIGRNVLSSSLSNITYRIQDNNTIILVVVLVVFTSVTIIGGYMMICKRKEN